MFKLCCREEGGSRGGLRLASSVRAGGLRLGCGLLAMVEGAHVAVNASVPAFNPNGGSDIGWLTNADNFFDVLDQLAADGPIIAGEGGGTREPDYAIAEPGTAGDQSAEDAAKAAEAFEAYVRGVVEEHATVPPDDATVVEFGSTDPNVRQVSHLLAPSLPRSTRTHS